MVVCTTIVSQLPLLLDVSCVVTRKRHNISEVEGVCGGGGSRRFHSRRLVDSPGEREKVTGQVNWSDYVCR